MRFLPNGFSFLDADVGNFSVIRFRFFERRNLEERRGRRRRGFRFGDRDGGHEALVLAAVALDQASASGGNRKFLRVRRRI